MDSSNCKFVSASSSSSSTTPVIKPSSTLKPSASDENCQSYQEKGVNPPKHFMSATISAASKAIAPRKKILGERNEISDTRIQKTPNIGSKGTFSSPDINNSDDSLSVNGDSSLRPYDPVKNCLSARPKFLRYKPNRGSEIILRYENEVKGKKERSSTGEGVSLNSEKDIDEVTDLVSASQEGFVELESEEVNVGEEGVEEEEEGEEEEEEEEGEGFWGRVLKFLLVLVVLVVSTMYISSSNSQTYSPTLQAMEGLKDGYLKIHDRFLNTMNFKEIVKLLEGGNEYLDGKIGLMKTNQTFIYEGIEEEEIIEDVYMVKSEEISDDLSEVVVEPQGGEPEAEVESEMGNEGKEMVEDVYMGESVEPAGESEEVCDLETAKTGEAVDQMLENFELEGTESAEKLELLQDNQIPTVTNALQQEDEVAMEAVQENNRGAEGLEMVGTENIMDKDGEVIMLEGMDSEITKSEILNFEAEDNLKKGLVEHIESDIIFKAIVEVTLFSAIVASLVLASHLMRKRNKKKDSSSLVMKPCTNKSVLEEKCSPTLFPNEREDHNNNKRVDDSFASPMPLINSSLIDSKELSQNRAPSIELLGEFVVGEMSSSRRRSSVMKSMEIESEVSSHSVSLDNKGFRSKTHSVPIHAQQDFSVEASAIHSLSYGYFTPEKKILKKEEEGIDVEAKKVVTTPLRRSSRLRNRVTSP
ncbi:hypothetical protein ACOSQ3_020622 [Xanthoceras sorbifolium]